MTAEEYRQRMIQAFHNADTDGLIAICVRPTEKEFEHLEWLLKNHYKQKPKTGHWIYDYTTADGHRTYHCSECGCFLKPKHSEPLNSFKWCSLCGTKMIESQESER